MPLSVSLSLSLSLYVSVCVCPCVVWLLSIRRRLIARALGIHVIILCRVDVCRYRRLSAHTVLGNIWPQRRRVGYWRHNYTSWPSGLKFISQNTWFKLGITSIVTTMLVFPYYCRTDSDMYQICLDITGTAAPDLEVILRLLGQTPGAKQI